MSEEKQPTPEKPKLTPEQEQQADDASIQGKYAGIDFLARASDLVDIFGPGMGYVALGETAFDGEALNHLIDLVQSANPADLEHAGEALEKATVAINSAAKDLNEFVKNTEWEGEGATAFQAYGSSVVGYAWGVAKVANAVGAQMKVASTGLASVRNAMPPRDNRALADQKRPEQFKAEEKRQDNPEYQKALQVEKDRQEAINQMNRLGSYYVVSQSTLASQKMPEPPTAYKAAVPKPSGWKDPGADSGSTEPRGKLSQSVTERTGAGERGDSETVSRTGTLGTAQPVPDSTSMEIDTVKTLPPTATPPSPTTGTPPTTQAPVPPMTENFAPPLSRTSPRFGPAGEPRRTGPSGTRQPLERFGKAGDPTTGRTAGPAGKNAVPPGRAPAQATGRANPTGRPPVVGTPPSTMRQGIGGTKGQPPVVGRPTGTGQPISGRNTGPAGTRGGRGDGIVGGKPQRATGGTTGSRLPRGTVVGGENPAAGRSSAARPSQTGVVGAGTGDKTNRPVGRGTPSANGVVGTPRTGARPGTGANGAGGRVSGAGRGNQRQRADDHQDREGTARPDHLTEDEETWANRRRGPVPPVIE
ncbi:hypothetical protein HW130_21660 [Streptomyces sp. PKU-EA00015]|uniref:hypothetical protein n=1 Tax=Streptomyces sp. PKU-EA00015 TaxID=2748326 RepID=UPI0015A4C9DB|nr:hypothetical protein [Streptomyces sp. PKU-EA00015]NWF28835.1 hypothetical protein [Streptomyces sp. PKU-EA00015]